MATANPRLLDNLTILRREFTHANEQVARSLEADDLTTANQLILFQRALIERLSDIVDAFLIGHALGHDSSH